LARASLFSCAVNWRLDEVHMILRRLPIVSDDSLAPAGGRVKRLR